jgi:hypothetical protein
LSKVASQDKTPGASRLMLQWQGNGVHLDCTGALYVALAIDENRLRGVGAFQRTRWHEVSAMPIRHVCEHKNVTGRTGIGIPLRSHTGPFRPCAQRLPSACRRDEREALH